MRSTGSSLQEWRGQATVVTRAGGQTEDASMMLVSVPQGQGLAVTHSGSSLQQNPPSFLTSLLGLDSNTEMYWIPPPDGRNGEYGLLETIHRRTAENTNYVLVQARHLKELQNNFCWPNGVPVDLSQDIFRLSKVTQTIRNLDSSIDDRSSGRDVKQGVREHLPEVFKNSYYLVRYRDYSRFAASKYYSQSLKESRFGKRYVERYFAVRVGGGSPGCFIPLSEAQCMFGWEKLVANHLESDIGSPSPQHHGSGVVSVPLPRLGLNPTEFESMMSLKGPTFYGDDDVRRQQQRSGAPDAERGGDSTYPSAWDWTPQAIQARWNHFLDAQFRRLGKATTKLIFLIGASIFAYYCVRRALSAATRGGIEHRQEPQVHYRRATRGGSGSSSSSRGSRGYDDDGYIPASLVQAVWSMNPKSVMDYLLAPPA